MLNEGLVFIIKMYLHKKVNEYKNSDSKVFNFRITIFYGLIRSTSFQFSNLQVTVQFSIQP